MKSLLDLSWLMLLFGVCHCKIFKDVEIGFEANDNMLTLDDQKTKFVGWKDCGGSKERIGVQEATLQAGGIVNVVIKFEVVEDLDGPLIASEEVLYHDNSLKNNTWRVIPCNGKAGSSCTFSDLCNNLDYAPCPAEKAGACKCPLEKGSYTVERAYTFGQGEYYVRRTLHHASGMYMCLDMMFINY